MTAFVSVCLGVLQQDPRVRQHLQRILERFYRGTGWRLRVTTIVAGAIPCGRYGWLERRLMRYLARKPGVETPGGTASLRIGRRFGAGRGRVSRAGPGSGGGVSGGGLGSGSAGEGVRVRRQDRRGVERVSSQPG
ncbi:MAG: hypothetical protein ACOY71_11635 [Gemmatimonadota bacterium]